MYTYNRSAKAPLFRIFLRIMPFFLDIFPYILRMRLSCRQPICLALPFLLGLGPLPLKADKVEKKELCHYRFKLPSKARIASQKQDLFIANAKYGSGPSAVGIQWLFSCTENLRRTSQSSEIMRKIREEGELLHHHETLHVDQNLEALFFSRTRIKKGRRLSSIEAYFAARNHEYHFYALAKDSEPIGINKEIHSELLAEMKKTLA